MLGKLGLSVGGILLALFVAEGALRLGPDGYDGHIRAFSAAAVESDPTLSHRLKPQVEVTVNRIHYRTSRLGTRGPDPREAPPSHRVLVLGDSVTMGWGVAEEETWPARVERAMDGDVEVINAAVLGWGVEQYVARFLELAPRLAPDTVLVGYFPNDPAGTEAVARSRPWFRSELLHRLRSRGAPNATDRHRALHAEGTPEWQTVERAFTELGAECTARRLRCAIVLLPSLVGQPYPLGAEHRRLEALATAHGFSTLDLAPEVAGRAPSELWVAADDSHPNAEAHGLYARAIAEWITTW